MPRALALMLASKSTPKTNLANATASRNFCARVADCDVAYN